MCSLRENIHEIVTVHSVHSNVAKIHSRLPAAMEFWLISSDVDKFCLSYDASILTPSSGFCTKNSLQSGSVTAKVGRLFIYSHSIKYCTCYNKKGCATLTHPFLFAFYLPASIAF